MTDVLKATSQILHVEEKLQEHLHKTLRLSIKYEDKKAILDDVNHIASKLSEIRNNLDNGR